VALDEPWTGTNAARRAEKRLNCENLTVHFYTNGLLQSILAQTNVLAQQNETRPGQAQPVHSELTATTANVFFFAHTNQVREIVAEQNVAILQADKKAHGEKAVYVASRREVELTGHPTAEMPMGRITHAQALIWNQAHNTLRATATGTNVVAEGMAPRKWGTNRLGPLFPKSK
jgi:lipopolysaccharide assembly outer membrane protein LptD (OstA)